LSSGGSVWLGDGAKERGIERSAIEDFDGCSTCCPIVNRQIICHVDSTVSREGKNGNRERRINPQGIRQMIARLRRVHFRVTKSDLALTIVPYYLVRPLTVGLGSLWKQKTEVETKAYY
jgi:hypothetical protein